MKILKMCGYCRWLEVTDSRQGGVRIQGEEAVYMDTWVTAVHIGSLYIQGWLYCRIESFIIIVGKIILASYFLRDSPRLSFLISASERSSLRLAWTFHMSLKYFTVLTRSSRVASCIIDIIMIKYSKETKDMLQFKSS